MTHACDDGPGRGASPMLAGMTNETIASLERQVLAGTPLSRPQAAWLARLDAAALPDLFASASRIRIRFRGTQVRCCSIVAAKVGACSEDCAFCSQSAHFKTPVRGLTVLPPDRVFDAAMNAADNGADSFGIVNSGYGPKDSEIEYWSRTIGRLRETSRIRACASLGILSEAQAQRLADAGVERYNHNLQTSRRFFPNIIRTHTFDERLATLHAVRAAGISVCSGALFGMGETWDDRIDLAMELRPIRPDVVPLNFLIAIDGTPLADTTPLPPMECLHIIAVYRFLFPDAEIKIAGGREVNLRDLQSWIFLAGADSFLIGNYLTTSGRAAEQDRQMLRDLGLHAAFYEASREPTPAPAAYV